MYGIFPFLWKIRAPVSEYIEVCLPIYASRVSSRGCLQSQMWGFLLE